MSGRPLDVLEDSLHEEVVVRLKDGSAYFGVLAGYDQHMNVVLDPTGEADVAIADEHEAAEVRDTTIIRGDNVVTIRA